MDSNTRLPPDPGRIIGVFDRLLAHPDVTERVELGGKVGVMALHGGLERRTATIAGELAEQTGASLYVVSQNERLRWHVPSIHYDPKHSDRLARFLGHVEVAVSLHGFGRRHLKRSVLVGGAEGLLADEMAARLRASTALDVVTGVAIPPGLRGAHPNNPVNLPSGGGVQLELSHSSRHAPHVDPLVGAIGGFLSARV